jgi:hypothetical protein
MPVTSVTLVTSLWGTVVEGLHYREVPEGDVTDVTRVTDSRARPPRFLGTGTSPGRPRAPTLPAARRLRCSRLPPATSSGSILRPQDEPATESLSPLRSADRRGEASANFAEPRALAHPADGADGALRSPVGRLGSCAKPRLRPPPVRPAGAVAGHVPTGSGPRRCRAGRPVGQSDV